MNVKDAIQIAKNYVSEVFADEQVTNVRLEETERDTDAGRWIITLGFSRSWNIPGTQAREVLESIGGTQGAAPSPLNTSRTRAQEILESLGGPLGGAAPSLRRTFKVITISDDGEVTSMKNRVTAEASE